MFFASRTVSTVVSIVVPRQRVARHSDFPPGAAPKDDHTYRMRPPLTLEGLNTDVLLHVVRELQTDTSATRALASCSHYLRELTAPVLFHRCRTAGQRCPEAIRPYVRRLRYPFTLTDIPTAQKFLAILEDLPSLLEIDFVNASGIPWEVMKRCLIHPHIRSLSFDTPHGFLSEGPYPQDEIATIPMQLSSFSFTTALWRKKYFQLANIPDSKSESGLALEALCLSVLVPRLHETAEQLTLPMEATPMLSMAERSWPKLQRLSFHGFYADATQMEALPLFISRSPRLRDLSITVRQWHEDGRRAPILGHQSSPGTPFQPAHISLRSLTVAYPDPEDDIFSVDTTDLHHLSLRDWPRYYGNLTYSRTFGTGSPAPILTNAECLSILRRMELPRLTSLELVYRADPGGADDELLNYIGHAFPQLAHLQLHRYRADREEHVDYEHIASLLTAVRSLRTVRLNLDLDGDHGPYCNYVPSIEAWRAKLRDEIGPRVVGILQDCPLLDCCELLYHEPGNSTWVELRPAHLPEPHFIIYHDADVHSDSELLPHTPRLRYGPEVAASSSLKHPHLRKGRRKP